MPLINMTAVDTVAGETSSPCAPPSSPTAEVGRWKQPPANPDDTSMKAASMTTEELSALAFEPASILDVITPSTAGDNAHENNKDTSHLTAGHHHHHHDAIPISSSSSTCTRESDTLSDAEGHLLTSRTSATATTTPVKIDRDTSERINAKVSLQKTSRQGRGSQRWVTTRECEAIRLVTGCVPILKGGKILLCSASRKPEWILPKGGWEMDEAMEESAVREVFEEAGVFGVLGPRLAEIQYETRKAKKRRLEQAELLERKLKKAEDPPTDADDKAGPTDDATAHHSGVSATAIASATSTPAPISKEDMTRIRSLSQECAPKHTDETASCASTHSSAYSQVRMTLFPLYVNQVLDTWPEKGRFRMAVDIDQAIDMLSSRPEFKAALVEVKERGLHLIA